MKRQNRFNTTLISNGTTKVSPTPGKILHTAINKSLTPIFTRSRTRGGQSASAVATGKVSNPKLGSELPPVNKVNSSVQTEISYSKLIDIDVDLLKKLDFITLQNESLVENTSDLQKLYESKLQRTQENLKQSEHDSEELKSKSVAKEKLLNAEISSLTEIIRLMEKEAASNIKNLENQLNILQGENMKLRDRIDFVTSIPGPSGPVSGSIISNSNPITLSNQFEALKKQKNDQSYVKKTNCAMILGRPKNRINKTLDLQVNQRSHNNITVIGDSHCRNLARCLLDDSERKLSVQGTTMPNAGVLTIAEKLKGKGIKSSLGECLVIVAGANDIYTGQVQNIYRHYSKKLLCNKVPLTMVVSIPLRRDLPLSHPINEDIINANIFLNDTAQTMENTYFLDITVFPESYTSKDGVHLNNEGKECLSKLIWRQYSSSITKSNMMTNYIKPTKQCTSSHMTQERHNQTYSLPKMAIKVVDGNIKDFINRFHRDKKTAFSHCISGDLEEEKQMSAGVAVVFRNSFGKPTPSDIVSNHLAYQSCSGNAGIYSLITKPKFFSKPSNVDYDAAFRDLAVNFRLRGFTHLVCSAMGCVRDDISTNHFAANLCKFQQYTKADIDVVVYKEPRKRSTKNGMSHPELLTNLKNSINAQQCNISRIGHLQSVPVKSMEEFPPLPSSQAEMDLLEGDNTTCATAPQFTSVQLYPMLQESETQQAEVEHLLSPLSPLSCGHSVDELSVSNQFHGWTTPTLGLNKLASLKSVITSLALTPSSLSSDNGCSPPVLNYSNDFLLRGPQNLSPT